MLNRSRVLWSQCLQWCERYCQTTNAHEAAIIVGSSVLALLSMGSCVVAVCGPLACTVCQRAEPTGESSQILVRNTPTRLSVPRSDLQTDVRQTPVAATAPSALPVPRNEDSLRMLDDSQTPVSIRLNQALIQQALTHLELLSATDSERRQALTTHEAKLAQHIARLSTEGVQP